MYNSAVLINTLEKDNGSQKKESNKEKKYSKESY